MGQSVGSEGGEKQLEFWRYFKGRVNRNYGWVGQKRDKTKRRLTEGFAVVA